VCCRGAELDRSLAGVTEDRRMREIRRHTRTQSQFLRLRRTKIGLQDFRTVKVIGKGAFGEVSIRFLTPLPDIFFFSIPRVSVAWGRIRVVFSFWPDCSDRYHKPILSLEHLPTPATVFPFGMCRRLFASCTRLSNVDRILTLGYLY
jgi:hypothetical protein